MDLRQLRYFLAVAETGSFHAAAKRLGITQQTVSSSVAQLEKALNVRLLERNARGAWLTPEGELLQSHSRRIAGDVQELRDDLERSRHGDAEVLRIGVEVSSAGPMLTRAIQHMYVERPHLRAIVRSGTSENLESALLNGQLDLIISPTRAVSPRSPLRIESLVEESFCLAVCPNHPLLAHKSVELKDLLPYRWITGLSSSPIFNALAADFARAGMRTPVSAIQTTSTSFARAMAMSTDFLLLASRDLIQLDIENKSLFTLNIDTEHWHRSVVAVLRNRGEPSPLVRTFLGLVRRNASGAGATPATVARRSHS